MAQLKANPWYLWVAFLSPSVVIFVQSVAPLEPTIKAQNLAVVLGLLGSIVVTALWLPYSSKERASGFLRLILVLVFIVWVLQRILSFVDGYVPNHTTYLLPLLLIWIYLKPPSRRGFMVAGLILGYSLIVTVLISLIVGGNFGVPDGFDVPDSAETRFPLLSNFLGIETRWGGAFGSVNYATPVGGLLVMLGFIYYKWNRLIFMGIGVVILFLSQSRTTFFALAIALLVLMLWSHRLSSWRFATQFRWIVGAFTAVTFSLYIALLDPTFNGRTPIWVAYWTEVSESLLTGIGSSGVAENIVEASSVSRTSIFLVHAHSVYLDGLTRYGILWLLITLGVFAVALRATWIARNGVLASRGIAMVTFIFLAGSTETIYSWAYVTIYVLALIYIVGLTRFSDSESQEVSSPVQN